MPETTLIAWLVGLKLWRVWWVARSCAAVFGALAGRAKVTAPWAMVSGVLLGSALWWLVLSSVVGLQRERFDQRWQRAVNLCSAGLLAGFAAWQLASLFA